MTRKRWRNPDKRMAEAVDLRRRGWSLRRIGTELAVSEVTIRRDLARWEREQFDALVELNDMRHDAATCRTDVALECRSNDAATTQEGGEG